MNIRKTTTTFCNKRSSNTFKRRSNLIRTFHYLFGCGASAIVGSLLMSSPAKAIPYSFEHQILAQSTNFSAQATFSLDTIWRYAAAVQEINPIREEHNQEINLLLRSNRPSRVCYQANIPWEVKQSCDLFGLKMIHILRKHNVDDVYTPISRQVRSDENLKRKIQKAGVCQQRGISLESCF